MKDTLYFAARLAGTNTGAEIPYPSELVDDFLDGVLSIVSRAADLWIKRLPGVDNLEAIAKELAESKAIDTLPRSVFRSRKISAAAADVISPISEELDLNKKSVAAVKDVLRIYSVRYALSTVGALPECADLPGNPVSAPAEGIFFIVNGAGWVSVKKIRITERTHPLDVAFYAASLSQSVYDHIDKVEARWPDALEIDGCHARSRSVRDALAASSVYVYYGPAYDKIKPPKRIKGVKIK